MWVSPVKCFLLGTYTKLALDNTPMFVEWFGLERMTAEKHKHIGRLNHSVQFYLYGASSQQQRQSHGRALYMAKPNNLEIFSEQALRSGRAAICCDQLG